METTRTDPIQVGRMRARTGPRMTRLLLVAALASFALPFLTVTCNSQEGVAVSGVQAATTIDLSAADTYDERELTREEPVNAFAMAALAATAIALVLTFGSGRARQTAVWAAAFGATALQAFFAYAVYRSWANALPEVGLSAATVLLVAASWAAVGRVPTWVAIGGVATAIVMVGATVAPFIVVAGYPVTFLAFYACGIVATALAVGAIRASVSEPGASPSIRPRLTRTVVVGLVGMLCLTAVGVAMPFLMGMFVSGEEGPPPVARAGAFAVVVAAFYVGASVGAWVMGTAIARGRRSTRARAVAKLA